MKKISFLFLFILWIFSCVNSSTNKNVRHDTVSHKIISGDSISNGVISSRSKKKDPNDTLVPEKMTAGKIIGVYTFYYGNWGFDLEITKNKIGERMSMPDTLDEGWIGTWTIKDDTLIAKGYTCLGGGVNPYAIGWPKSDRIAAEYYYSLEYEIKRMDNVIANGWKSTDKDDEVIAKFILVKGNLVELDDMDDGYLFPEELTRVR
jgi:hypothetical protein